MKAHILVVDDDPRITDLLRRILAYEGYSVASAASGNEALNRSLERPPDLVVLDIMLPGLNGLEVAQRLREAGDNVPILMLTARDTVADRVQGLETGADDYLVKPFAFSELLARARSLLRRGPARQLERLRLADLEVDLIRHKASREGKPLDLAPKEFALLSLLVRRTGEVLSRTLIAEQVWDMNFDSETNVVDVAVRRLRRKVDDPYPRKLIHTVRGVGYVLEER